MGRRPEVAGKPAIHYLTIRVNGDMLTFIDTARGKDSRSKFIRDLIRDRAKGRK